MTITDRRAVGAGTRDIYVTGSRVRATLIDGLFFYVLYGVLAGFLGTLTYHDDAYWTATMPVAGNIVFGLLVVLYYVVLETYRGQTLGKLVVGIAVVDEFTGGRPTLSAVALRTALRLVDGLVCYLVGFVTVLATRKRQRLGDLAAHTLVMRTRDQR